MKPIVEKAEISDIASEGKSLVKIDGKIIFVKNTVPGDVVDIEIFRQKKKFSEGRAIHFHKYSEKRINPSCEHFGTCGGCQWQHLDYNEQLKFKEKEVLNNLMRIGKIEIGEVLPIIAANKTFFYRNKLEFTFSNHRWLTQQEIESKNIFDDRDALGFHIPGNFSKVLDIHQCWLQENISNEIRLSIKQFAIENHLPFFNLVKQEGLLRNLIIRNTTLNEWMVIVCFVHDDEAIKKLLDHLLHQFPPITSLHYVINPKRNDTIFDLEVFTYHGKGYISEQLGNSVFKIGPKSFFQTNSLQAKKLYDVVVQFAGLNGTETVYDLYTGTGSIAIYIAGKCNKMVGIEQIPEAIEDAKFNAQKNNIYNIHFFSGDIAKTFEKNFIAENGKPDLIITDPPRSGMHPDVIKNMLEADAEKIIYVSCNTATQARDLQLLNEKYVVEKIQPVDMFPHTHHIENVALLKKKTGGSS